MNVTMTAASDDEVLKAARAGSSAALGELYRRHARMVHSVAYRLTLQWHDAEDVLQDVFIALPEALKRYDSTRPFEPWLRRVTVRAALVRLRAEARRARREARSDPPDPHVSVLDSVALREALLQIPLHLRVVLLLKEYEGYSHEEIGTMLGIRAETSAVRLHRAWKLLRKELG
jgi:RNA polymerase sigma factor (sigma-70 family)